MRTDHSLLPTVLAALAVLCPVPAWCGPYPAKDMSYGGQPDGVVRVGFDRSGNFSDVASAAVVISGERLLLAGQVETGISAGSPTYEAGFAALDRSGQRDAAFGAAHDGLALAGQAPNGAQQVVKTADGNYVFLGKLSDASAVIGRIDATGAIDTTFNGTGRRNLGPGVFLDAGTSLRLSGLVALPDGKVLVSGYAGNSTTVCAAVARLNVDGSTDTGFAAGRGAACEAPLQQGTRVAGAFTIARTSNGSILLGGTAQHPGGSGFDMAIARFSANGVLDTTFGPAHDGWAFVAFDRGGTLNDWAYALAIDTTDRIVVAGLIEGAGSVDTTIDYDIGVARLLADGAIDASFATGGSRALDLGLGGHSYDFVHSAFVLADRRILLGGYSQKTNTVGTAIELSPDGALETTFGTGGIFLQADPDGAASTLLASQRMVVSGGYLYMVGQIVNPVLLPNSQRNLDFGAIRYELPLFADGFESSP